MKIVVCIKQVPNVKEVSWDPETGSLIRKGIPSIINPNDKNAIEAALQLKEKHGGEVTILSMGPSQVEEALREALGMGADKAIQLTDKDFAGSDTWATSYTLGQAIQKIGDWDLILSGVEALDGNTAQVGPQIAEHLGVPLLSYALQIDVIGSDIQIKQKLGNYHRVLKAPLPALVTVERECNEPRVPPMDMIMEAYEKEIQMWKTSDIVEGKEHLGLKGSPTKLRKVFSNKRETGKVEFISGTPEEIAVKLVAKLKEKYLI